MPQLQAYYRPRSVDEVLQLLARPGRNTAILAGGTYLTAHMPEMVDELVDLQAVAGLDAVEYTGQGMTLGAMVRLQTIVEDERAPALLREAAHREGPNTFRHVGTIGGVIVGSDKESELLAALLVFEAELQIQTGSGIRSIPLTTFLQDVPAALGDGLLVSVSLTTLGNTASDRVARTPADKPIVAALARLGGDGHVRLALCGVANTPVLIDPDNVKAGINPPDDFRGSKEYRRQMASVLAQRVINAVRENQQ